MEAEKPLFLDLLQWFGPFDLAFSFPKYPTRISIGIANIVEKGPHELEARNVHNKLTMQL